MFFRFSWLFLELHIIPGNGINTNRFVKSNCVNKSLKKVIRKSAKYTNLTTSNKGWFTKKRVLNIIDAFFDFLDYKLGFRILDWKLDHLVTHKYSQIRCFMTYILYNCIVHLVQHIIYSIYSSAYNCIVHLISICGILIINTNILINFRLILENAQ